MKFTEIQKIGNRIAKLYGMPNVIVDKLKDKESGQAFAEVRTELPSYDGGDEFQEKVMEKLGYESENLGGCVYGFYNWI